ncbi:MAG: hypothetical protein JO174_03940, partial [Herbaspirillum sp.]|nr:hypothetical protein [Herbaspirillum sp.]
MATEIAFSDEVLNNSGGLGYSAFRRRTNTAATTQRTRSIIHVFEEPIMKNPLLRHLTLSCTLVAALLAAPVHA